MSHSWPTRESSVSWENNLKNAIIFDDHSKMFIKNMRMKNEKF